MNLNNGEVMFSGIVTIYAANVLIINADQVHNCPWVSPGYHSFRCC